MFLVLETRISHCAGRPVDFASLVLPQHNQSLREEEDKAGGDSVFANSVSCAENRVWNMENGERRTEKRGDWVGTISVYFVCVSICFPLENRG